LPLHRPPRALAVAGALAVVYLVWGSTYLGIEIAIETLPPLLMAGVRFLTAGVLLFVVASAFADRDGDPLGPRQWLAALATGGPLFVVGNGGVVLGQETLASGIAALLVASVALWIALLDRVLFGRRLSRRAIAGLLVGFLGVALLVDPRGDVDPAGAAIVAVASVGWAIGTLLSRGASLPRRPLVAAGMQMIAGGAVLVVLAAARGELGDVDVSAFSGRSLAALVYLVVFGSVVAFSAYAWLIRAARTSLVATYAYVNPVVAVALGAVVLGEALTARTVFAGAVIVGGVALIVGAGGRQPEPSGSPAVARLLARAVAAARAAG
jgi:drug/metabolite transporter (DMT)-like permease